MHPEGKTLLSSILGRLIRGYEMTGLLMARALLGFLYLRGMARLERFLLTKR